MTGIERTEQRNQRVDDRLSAGQLRKIEPEFPTGWSKIENTIFYERRGQRIRVAMIKANAKRCNASPIS